MSALASFLARHPLRLDGRPAPGGRGADGGRDYIFDLTRR